MEMALYFPELGYYTRESASIGRAGDFYTSPHLHSFFGVMTGRQMEEMWDIMGKPDRFDIVEMGAGMGHLAADVIRSLQGRDISGALSYTIVEMNPWMRERQSALLKDFDGTVSWVSSLDELSSISGCFLSNELLDAFPVKVVEMKDELMEIYVSAEGERFIEVMRTCGPEIREYFADFSVTLPRGYRTEVNLKIGEWLHKVSRRLSRGFILTIDYGYSAREYYDEERNRGTLLAYYRHTVHEDPYVNVGDQDLTAHVNFSALKLWGQRHGIETLGYCPQGTFLIAMGIDEVLLQTYGDNPDPFEMAKIKGLFLPQGMGESHRVMVQYRGEGRPKLRGFSLRNQMRYL
jgi:SAM-dependent MidA family methyltransferase